MKRAAILSAIVTLLAIAGCAPPGGAASGPPPDAGEGPRTGEPPREPAAGTSGESAQPPHATPPKSGRRANRLAGQTSPYLLMHAHNPVDWYPWGEEALEKARRENKPIFLSVGYSTCYWCHVMERESFMDDEIAAFLNEHFVPVKVDREERPDLDSIYMTSVHIVAGRGGWPMSVFLTPEGRPFFGGTYFPARDDDRPGVTGFLTILHRVHELWTDQEDAVRQNAEQLAGRVRTHLRGQRPLAAVPITERQLAAVQAELAEEFDAHYGGFGFDPRQPQRPKFPSTPNLCFLLARMESVPAGGEEAAPAAATTPAPGTPAEARHMLIFSLEKMARGGIYDHLGGGFHRYSVDRRWEIPHFEKMLYDNGQLLSVYARAHAATGREEFRRVSVETAEFVLREMTDPRGGFYSAQDAESEHEEGKFYRWEKDEPAGHLSADEAALFAAVYGLAGEPNFEHRFFVPQLARPLAELAAERGMRETELVEQLAPVRQKLLEARGRRVRPLTDTKILTSWNGLMIRGMADAGRILGDDRYTEAAARAADFVLAELRGEDGRLSRSWREGKVRLAGYLDDYAFLVDGLIALHEATGQDRWLEAADELTARQIDLFWDERDGGFFFTARDHEELIARGKILSDGAEPAGNSLAAANLLYLAKALSRAEYEDRARRTIQSGSAILESTPAAVPCLALAAVELLKRPAAD